MYNAMSQVHARIRSTGVTLVELMIAIAIGAILVGIAVPSFQNVVMQSRISAHVNDMVSAINLARSEAVKRGGGATVCRSSDQATCATATAGWESGWIVFSDVNMNGAVDTGDTLINAFSALSSGSTAVANAGMTNAIVFVANGRPTATFTGAQTLICPAGSNPTFCRYICVNSQGRPRVDTPAEYTAATCGT